MRSYIPKKNTPDKDIVMTPFNIAKTIIDHFVLKGIVLDPCRGTGAFYNQFPDHVEKDWCELSEGKDFFTYNRKVDWIITNPPWSKIKDFITHSCKISDNVCFLIPFNHFSTKARIRIIHDHGYGIKEFYGVPTPKFSNWPQSGFQLGVTHIAKGYKGPITISGEWGR